MLHYYRHPERQERNRKLSDFFCGIILLLFIIVVASCAIDLLFKLL